MRVVDGVVTVGVGTGVVAAGTGVVREETGAFFLSCFSGLSGLTGLSGLVGFSGLADLSVFSFPLVLQKKTFQKRNF